MSEEQFEHWLNLSPEQQRQSLGVLVQYVTINLDYYGCGKKCGQCLDCQVRAALVLVKESKP